MRRCARAWLVCACRRNTQRFSRHMSTATHLPLPPVPSHSARRSHSHTHHSTHTHSIFTLVFAAGAQNAPASELCRHPLLPSLLSLRTDRVVPLSRTRSRRALPSPSFTHAHTHTRTTCLNASPFSRPVRELWSLATRTSVFDRRSHPHGPSSFLLPTQYVASPPPHTRASLHWPV
jgi:hypothetical protein